MKFEVKYFHIYEWCGCCIYAALSMSLNGVSLLYELYICCLLKRPVSAVLELWDRTYIYMNEPWFLNLENELWLLRFTCTLCCVFNELLIATWYCVEDICCCWCISYIGDPIEWYMLLVFWAVILKCVNLDCCKHPLEDWSCDHILRERRLLRLPIMLTA